jgi:hypothetical protein
LFFPSFGWSQDRRGEVLEAVKSHLFATRSAALGWPVESGRTLSVKPKAAIAGGEPRHSLSLAPGQNWHRWSRTRILAAGTTPPPCGAMLEATDAIARGFVHF